MTPRSLRGDRIPERDLFTQGVYMYEESEAVKKFFEWLDSFTEKEFDEFLENWKPSTAIA
jgi:hypothetical protein